MNRASERVCLRKLRQRVPWSRSVVWRRTDAKFRHGASWRFRALHDQTFSDLDGTVKQFNGLPGHHIGLEHAPTSIKVAPSTNIFSTCCKTEFSSAYFPPSKNEFGVIFRIPITLGKVKSIKFPLQLIVISILR